MSQKNIQPSKIRLFLVGINLPTYKLFPYVHFLPEYLLCIIQYRIKVESTMYPNTLFFVVDSFVNMLRSLVDLWSRDVTHLRPHVSFVFLTDEQTKRKKKARLVRLTVSLLVVCRYVPGTYLYITYTT